MSNRKETERSKLLQEKCQTLLTQMLRDEDNKYCVDCDAKGPRWASWNIGVLLCIRCAGIHRNLGVHISRVKSVNLDSWTPEQVVSLQQMGNSRARAVYEAQLPDGFRRPQNDSALESFIRAKYEHKKYLAREWVPPPPPKVDWNKEIDEEIEKQKRKKRASAVSAALNLSSPTTIAVEKKTSAPIKTPLPAPLPKPKANANSPKSSRSELNKSINTSSDLLGLSTPSSENAQPISDPNDMFCNFLSATVPNATPLADTVEKVASGNPGDNLAKQEADFFNQSVPNETEKAKLTKDSILALYTTGTINSFSNMQIGSSYPNFNSAASSMPPQYQTIPNSNQFMAGGLNHQFGGQPHNLGMVGGARPPQMQPMANQHQFVGLNNHNMPNPMATNGLNNLFSMQPTGNIGAPPGGPQHPSQYNPNLI